MVHIEFRNQRDHMQSVKRDPSITALGVAIQDEQISFKVGFNTLFDTDDWTTIEVLAHLSSPQLNILSGEDQKTITIRNGKSTRYAIFTGIVDERLQAGDQIQIDVTFYHNDRKCGWCQQNIFV